jgi:hypothetical protein
MPRSIQKPGFHLGRRHHAGVGAPEKTVTVASDLAVQRIAQRRGHTHTQPCNTPWPTQVVQRPQEGTGVLPTSGAVHQQQGLQPLDLSTHLVQQSLAGDPLNGRKTENTPAVMVEQKPHPAVAQQALHIKDQNQGSGFRRQAQSASAVVLLTSSITAYVRVSRTPGSCHNTVPANSR